jgi:hypothetical protein
MDQAMLEKEALRLPPGERALLADMLLGSLDDEAAREVEAAWVRVAEERLAAYRRGDEPASDGPQVIAELRSRYRR